jgi:hypothetical protein
MLKGLGSLLDIDRYSESSQSVAFYVEQVQGIETLEKL